MRHVPLVDIWQYQAKTISRGFLDIGLQSSLYIAIFTMFVCTGIVLLTYPARMDLSGRTTLRTQTGNEPVND